MRVVYSDESGVGDKEREPITVITALMVNMDRIWVSAEKELRHIRDETPAILLHEGRELKGKNLYSAVRKVDRLKREGKDDPDLRTLEKAIDILRRLLAVPINYRIPIFYAAVDRAGYDTYGVNAD